jgi:DNA-binding protein
LVLLIAEVVGVIQTDTDRERGATEVVLQARGSTTAIRIEKESLVKILPKRNVDVKEINLGSTGTELGLPMLLTQNPTKIEMRRTLTFYRKALAIPLHRCAIFAYTYVHSLY